jgi:hypothetical protein
MGTTTILFVREKLTKNTVRFAEQVTEGQQPTVGTLYVAKPIAGDAEMLRVTIEEVK